MKKLKILVVDDEPETGMALGTWLERRGYEAAYVTSPDAADRALGAENFDVILSDIKMRGNFRLEWIGRLLRHEQTPPVLLMTGDPELETAILAANLPIAGYLLKPLDHQEAATMINRVGVQLEERREALAAMDEISSYLAAEGAAGKPVDAVSHQLKALAQKLAELVQPFRPGAHSERVHLWRDAIVDTITVLERTKHSFRSRELGALRQRLLRLVPQESFQAYPAA